MPMQNHWEHFSHQADIGVRGIGSSKEAAFEQAAIALTAVTTDPYTVAPNEVVGGPFRDFVGTVEAAA